MFSVENKLAAMMFINMRITYEKMRLINMFQNILDGLMAITRPFAALLKSRKFWLYVAINIAAIVMYSNSLIDATRLSEVALIATGVLTGAIAFEDGMKKLGGLLIGLTKGFNPAPEQK